MLQLMTPLRSHPSSLLAILYATTLCLSAASLLRAEDSPSPVLPANPPTPDLPAPPARPAVPPGLAVPATPNAAASKAMKKSLDAIKEPREVAMEGLDRLSEQLTEQKEALDWTMKSMVNRRTSTSRALFIPTATPAPDLIQEAEEDLNVMAKLISKSIGKNGSEETDRAMGIPLLGTDRARGLRSIQVQGQGALFLFRVSFPLKAPEDRPPSLSAKRQAPDEWDQARQELYGKSEGSEEAGIRSRLDFTPNTEPYDAGAVEDLKQNILQSLKHASRMRHLGPEEFITILVQGPEEDRQKLSLHRIEGKNTMALRAWAKDDSGLTRSSNLSVRVRKTDIDEFASGKTSLAEFQKRANLLIYQGERPLETSRTGLAR